MDPYDDANYGGEDAYDRPTVSDFRKETKRRKKQRKNERRYAAAAAESSESSEPKETPEQKAARMKVFDKEIEYFKTLICQEFCQPKSTLVVLNPEVDLLAGTELGQQFDELLKDCRKSVLISVDTERLSAHSLCRLGRFRPRRQEMYQTLNQFGFRGIKEELGDRLFVEGQDYFYESDVSKYATVNDQGHSIVCTLQIAARGKAMYLRISDVDISALLTHRTDVVALRIQNLKKVLEDRKILKVFSNAQSDTIPLLIQTNIDTVGWLEINMLAEALGFREYLGRNTGGQPRGLKELGFRFGVPMKDFDFNANFAHPNPDQDLIWYAIVDAILALDIAIVLLCNYTKSIDQWDWKATLLKKCGIEEAVQPNYFEVPLEAMGAVRPFHYRDYDNPNVQAAVMKVAVPYYGNAEATAFSRLQAFVHRLENELERNQSIGFLKLINITQKLPEEDNLKPRVVEETDGVPFGWVRNGIIFEKPPFGINVLQINKVAETEIAPWDGTVVTAYPDGSVHFRDFDKKQKQALNTARDQACHLWAVEALANLAFVKSLQNDSELEWYINNQ